jgi:hypothetical protein
MNYNTAFVCILAVFCATAAAMDSFVVLVIGILFLSMLKETK